MNKEFHFPNFSENSIRNLIQEIYGLEVSATKLDGEMDFNFRVETENGIKYIFKIFHPEQSRELLEAQHLAMIHLAEDGKKIQCPQPVRTLSGDTLSIATCQENHQSYYSHLLTFIEGDFYFKIQSPPAELEKDLGRFLGMMDRKLGEFSHPALNRYLIWDLKNIRDIRPFLEYIPEIPRRNLVWHFIQMYENSVEPLRHYLRHSVIHNDANDYNILVDKTRTGVAGIIDFGDMVYSLTIQELAAALAYAIMGREDILETIIHIVSGYQEIFPLEKEEIEVLFVLMAARLCTSVALAAHRLKHFSQNEYLQISVAPAWETLEQMARINPALVTRALRSLCGFPEKTQQSSLQVKEILGKRQKQIGRALGVSYQQPLKLTSGFMQYLFDNQGRAYLDTVNNVCHVGHCHPRVVEAAQRQMERLNTNTRYLYDSFVELAESLCSTLPHPLRVCYFVNSGSEANELAIRLAKTFTGNRDFIVIDSAYHGNTNAAIEISPYKYEGPGGTGRASHIHQVRIPDTYRGEFRRDDPQAGEKYSRDIETALGQITGNKKKIAGFIAESVIGVGGQIFFPKNYLKKAYERVRNAGGICIADEVQVGFGRVGSHFWGFELQGVIPDVVTMGKPMGNGHPLAAVVTTPEIDAVFANGMEYFNTFGGNPVSCVIGKTVLEVIKSENLQQNAAEVGDYFLKQLQVLMNHHPLIGDVRGKGLFIGIELVLNRQTLAPARDQAQIISNRMREEGILTSIDGALRNVIKIKPPLVFNQENADLYIQKLDRILKEDKLKIK